MVLPGSAAVAVPGAYEQPLVELLHPSIPTLDPYRDLRLDPHHLRDALHTLRTAIDTALAASFQARTGRPLPERPAPWEAAIVAAARAQDPWVGLLERILELFERASVEGTTVMMWGD